ncbi:unnamed protein product [Boreogadus saida]
MPEERSGQTKASAMSYGEALKQQIQEIREGKTRDREESERYHAKLEEEMRAYEPWGRGGAGAPIRDKGGNLISDLKKMHKTNENAYINSGGGARTEGAEPSPQAAVPQDNDVAHNQPQRQTAGVTPREGAPHFARNKVFPDEPRPHRLLEQKDYLHCLELQMEEKKRKQEEEREEARKEEERMEHRMQEEQALMKREFQQEQEKKRSQRLEQTRSNGELMQQAEERRRQAERRNEEEEERERKKEKEAPGRRTMERQEGAERRLPSPLIPTLQRRLGTPNSARPPPRTSQTSSGSQSDGPSPAPYSPPVPARKNQLRARGRTASPEDRQEVIRELSALRRHLSAERRRVERLARRRETPTTPRRPPRSRLPVQFVLVYSDPVSPAVNSNRNRSQADAPGIAFVLICVKASGALSSSMFKRTPHRDKDILFISSLVCGRRSHRGLVSI